MQYDAGMGRRHVLGPIDIVLPPGWHSPTYDAEALLWSTWDAEYLQELIIKVGIVQPSTREQDNRLLAVREYTKNLVSALRSNGFDGELSTATRDDHGGLIHVVKGAGQIRLVDGPSPYSTAVVFLVENDVDLVMLDMHSFREGVDCHVLFGEVIELAGSLRFLRPPQNIH